MRASVGECAEGEDAWVVTVDAFPPASAATLAPEAALGAAAAGSAAAGQRGARSEAGEGWRALRMRVHLGYPQRPPVLLFGAPPAGFQGSVKVPHQPTTHTTMLVVVSGLCYKVGLVFAEAQQVQGCAGQCMPQ